MATVTLARICGTGRWLWPLALFLFLFPVVDPKGDSRLPQCGNAPRVWPHTSPGPLTSMEGYRDSRWYQVWRQPIGFLYLLNPARYTYPDSLRSTSPITLLTATSRLYHVLNHRGETYSETRAPRLYKLHSLSSRFPQKLVHECRGGLALFFFFFFYISR